MALLRFAQSKRGAGELFRRFSLVVGYRTFSVAYAAAAEEERHLEVGTHKIREEETRNGFASAGLKWFLKHQFNFLILHFGSSSFFCFRY